MSLFVVYNLSATLCAGLKLVHNTFRLTHFNIKKKIVMEELILFGNNL